MKGHIWGPILQNRKYAGMFREHLESRLHVLPRNNKTLLHVLRTDLYFKPTKRRPKTNTKFHKHFFLIYYTVFRRFLHRQLYE